jgi:uncharacterized protein YkwD
MKRFLPVILLSICGCIQPAPDPGPSGPAPAAGQVLFASELIAAHNAFRQSKGLAILVQDSRLQAACEQHARDMAAHGFMSHTGSDWSSPFARMTRAGYPWSSAGENVAWNQQTVDAVMSCWELSPGHRLNILSGAYKNIGAACCYSKTGQPYWCVDFGSPGFQGAGPAADPKGPVTDGGKDASDVHYP